MTTGDMFPALQIKYTQKTKHLLVEVQSCYHFHISLTRKCLTLFTLPLLSGGLLKHTRTLSMVGAQGSASVKSVFGFGNTKMES